MNNKNGAQNYATMSVYNQGTQIQPPAPSTSGLYVVPVFGTYGYSSLTGERIGMPPSPTGYFTLGTAYGTNELEYTGTPYVRSTCM
jgi:hypothetical protein